MDRRIWVAFLLSSVPISHSSGQMVIHSVSDFSTLPALQNRSAASQIDRIDNYSGTAGIRIPLLTIGGRGEAS